LDAYDEPTTATAIDGEVVLSGPDSVAVSITPDAADESARRMIVAANEARRQLAKAKPDR